MGNLVKAYERGKRFVSFPLEDVLEKLKTAEAGYEAAINMVIKTTDEPWLQRVREFEKQTFGVGKGIYRIVGLLPPISNFPNPAKLWKYCGLHVFDGQSVRRPTCGPICRVQGCRHDRFSPKMRSYVIARLVEAIIQVGGPYRVLYDARKLHTMTVHPEWGTENAKAPKGHYDKDARRYVAKRILRDLWRAAQGSQCAIDTPILSASTGSLVTV